VPPASGPTTGGPRPEPPPGTREPTGGPATEEPTRSQEPRPSTRPPATNAPDPDPPPATKAPDPDPPPATQAPDPDPPAKNPEPLISVSVKVSLDVPLLNGGGDGLLDADVGLGVGSSLLGLVVVPGSVLLGRQIVARRVRRPRDGGKP
jgi:hypothetical protein